MAAPQRQVFSVSGMSCAACSARVENGVGRMKGICSVQVSLLSGRMVVEYIPELVQSEQIITTVERMGYAAALGESKQSISTTQSTARMRRQFIRSALLLIPLMALHHLCQSSLCVWLQLTLLIPIIIVNRRFFVRGMRGLWQKAPNMDTLVAIGATAAAADGVCNMIVHHRGEFYFESAAMILTLISLGKWLEARATAKTSMAVEKLSSMLPATATVKRGEKTTCIPADAVLPGDIVLVQPGAVIPIDGTVLSGNSMVNESALTGESLPVDKTAGDTVYAATTNGHGLLHIQATRVRAESAMADIIKLVGDAAATKAPISRLADRVASIFVPVVMVLALITGLVWWLAGDSVSFAISCSIAVLVISCPCALGLATPVAIMVGVGKGAEGGILYRSGEALEQTRNITALVLDKTGTLTCGHPHVCQIESAHDTSQEELLQLAATIEHGSNHPLARAISAACNIQSPPTPDTSLYHPGRGIEARLGHDLLLAGNAAFMQDMGIEGNDHMRIQTLEKEGKTPICFARNQQFKGIIAIQDTLRKDAPKAIKAWQNMGIKLYMMTGDNQRTAAAMAAQLGITHFQAHCLPADKEQLLARLKAEGEIVGMIGDGINDAPALMRADVGISLGGGADIAKESADIVLVHNQLGDVVQAIRLSRAVIRNIRQNLFWAFAYNTLAIPLAAGVFYPFCGWLLHPAVAAAAMGLSSLCVVSNALRLRRFSLHEPTTMNNELTLTVTGMMCPHCEQHVTKALLALPGILSCSACHKTNSVSITLAPDGASDLDTIKATISAAGYEVK